MWETIQIISTQYYTVFMATPVFMSFRCRRHPAGCLCIGLLCILSAAQPHSCSIAENKH